ncbi:hypothetical protein A3B84_00110 [Candidatus Nomurabacteria bacterium RIFCSPHIGHO2_02_FULL_35_13]|uniref:Uncharacterized protein n=1 Tax=Candidatus Nomurabacteria bacterium RIFCSPHIGHO2_02_FULL_35_13 TaxID=1801748 RepID=A0A1F6VQD5_9BACT|nr:MAG: hypothetical protein A3B84_00110 [Candidatus Nomurabacteria bacterium RIFCSPHIGHO2_02_FULL_35_13]
MEKSLKFAEKTKEKEPQINMEKFRGEIVELKEKAEKGEVGGGPELLKINPEELTEEDARMWYKYKSNSMTEADINDSSDYHRDVEKDIKNLNYNSRENFRAFFRQVFTYPWLLEQQRQHEDSLRKGK